MPGSRRVPVRPRRLWTFSRDRLCLSNGGGAVGVAFGLLFSSTGLLAFAAFGWSLMSAAGWVPAQGSDIAEQPLWKTVLAIGGVLLIGLGHLAVGTLLLCTQRTTFDRARDGVTVRTGWLGLRCQREKLSAFQRVIVCPSTQGSRLFRSGEARYDIVLDGESGRTVIVGFVSRSDQLAREVAGEIARFTGLTAY